jgi:3-oxoacyl-[acyl-carrier-protein] synthase III
MAKCRVSNIAIRGIVCAVPGVARPVEEFGTEFEFHDVEKMKSAVGLREMYRVKSGQTAGDLCEEAAKALLDDLGWDRSTIDGIIMVTQYPDYFCPATACVLHGKLALPDSCFAYDVNLGCSAYVYGLWIASQSIATGTAKRVLLLEGDTPSVTASPLDRSVAMLFGDAGTATALEYDQAAAPISFVLGSDGKGANNLIVPAGAFRRRPEPEAFERTMGSDGNVRSPMDLYMDGLAIFNFTLERVPPLVRDILELHGWQPDQVDSFVFHQANAFMLKALARKMRIPVQRMPINIDKYGNTSMSSIPLVLADDLSAVLRGAQPRNLLLAGFGIGYSWAGAAMTFCGLKTAKVIHSDLTEECLTHSTSAAK